MVELALVPSPPEDSRRERVRPKRLKGWVAPPVVPRHVGHCFSGTGCRDWSIYTWRVNDPKKRVRVPYRCNSWRCEACAPHEAAVLFRRITDACAPLDPKGFVFMVLTLDQRGYFDKSQAGWRKFRDVREAYRELGRQSQKFLFRLRRWQEKRGMQPIANQWFAVVEAHKNGWPHMNLVLYSPQLAEHLEQDKAARRAAGETNERKLILVERDLRAMVQGAGWGRQSTAERARDRKALAGYVTKLAGLSDATAGEVAKITQAPTAAPVKFRRLRSGKGFLPPRQGTSDGWTGALIRRQVCNDGMPVVLPLHKVSPEHAINVQDACELEDRLWEQERETLWRKRREVARYGPQSVLGPLVKYFDGDRECRPVEASLDDIARFGAPVPEPSPVVARSAGGEPICPYRGNGEGHGIRDGPIDLQRSGREVQTVVAIGSARRSGDPAGDDCVARDAPCKARA